MASLHLGKDEQVTPSIAELLQSSVNLEAIQMMTSDLDTEVANCQKTVVDIQAMLRSLNSTISKPIHMELKHEEILEGSAPNLLLPDMEMCQDIDIADTIYAMVEYVENLKQIVNTSQGPESDTQFCQKYITSLDLSQYTNSLEQFRKQLSNVKINRNDQLLSRNEELEAKLAQLCQDVNMFTQMVQAKTTISECNKNWKETQQNSSAFQYDVIINSVHSRINEVTYLLQNKN